jgi:hypothetical protein
VERLFWLEIGERVTGAIDTAPAAIPTDLLPERPRLKVALFGFPGEIGIREGTGVGEIEMLPDGTGRVVQPASRPGRLTDSRLLARRLFFPVSIPRRAGTFRLRCNIYCRQVLVQSHLVTAEVAAPSAWRGWLGRAARRVSRRRGAARLRTTVDYTLSHSLREPVLQEIEPHRLSLMLNENGDGSVGFRFFGSDGDDFKRDAAITALELQDLIERARAAMRISSWGRATPWQGELYRYEDGLDLDRLRGDLVLFARWGYRFYDALAGRLAGAAAADAAQRRQAVRRLHELMRRPGFVQVASKLSARHATSAGSPGTSCGPRTSSGNDPSRSSSSTAVIPRRWSPSRRSTSSPRSSRPRTRRASSGPRSRSSSRWPARSRRGASRASPGGEPIGEAVRKARLTLLHGGNPLGLVYLPFVVAHLRLVGGGVWCLPAGTIPGGMAPLGGRVLAPGRPPGAPPAAAPVHRGGRALLRPRSVSSDARAVRPAGSRRRDPAHTGRLERQGALGRPLRGSWPASPPRHHERVCHPRCPRDRGMARDETRRPAMGNDAKGVLHRTRAPERTVVLMIEGAGVVPTGD